MRNHDFDDAMAGDSTARFLDAVGELATLRDTLLQGWAADAVPSRPRAQRPRSRSTR
jgi:hypothetical protein